MVCGFYEFEGGGDTFYIMLASISFCCTYTNFLLNSQRPLGRYFTTLGYSNFLQNQNGQKFVLLFHFYFSTLR